MTMFEYLPIALVCWWILFHGSIHTNQRHMKYYLDNGKEDIFFMFLTWYTTIGSILGMVTMVVFFMIAPWYAPVLMIAISFVVSPVLYGTLDAIVGNYQMSIISIFVWPVSLFMAYRAILVL